MNTKLLRQKVLDLAIHGKLVPQNPEHEPASALLEKVKTCNSESIDFDNIPFEIPKTWVWCNINTINNYKTITVNPQNNKSTIYELYSIPSFEKKYPEIVKGEEIESSKIAVNKDDILLSKINPRLNRVWIVTKHTNNELIASGEWIVIRNENLFQKYLMYIFQSPYFVDKMLTEVSGVGGSLMRARPEAVKKYLFPLPPLEEQKLIVEEIERIFALIDTIEQNKTDLETVIKQTKSKILDLAIHGKLVPQDKADEPASKMLEKLRAEKEEKIANGQLKRDKNDSYIYKSGDGKWLEKKADGSEEEIEVPFEIPESWSWCRLPSVCRRNITDGTHNSPPTNDKGEFLYITAKNIKLSGIDLSNVSYVSKEIHDVIYGRCPVELNDVLLTKDGTIGEVTVNNLDYPFSLLSSVALIKPSNIVESWFITYVLKSDYMQNIMKGSSKGVALKRIILEQINQLLIPIPPLEAQKRIIEKIQRIFFLLDKL
ncbi:MAG: restriction endonuclease subunit S [Treponema sp.]|nr:restriction endonuclease subunit S [Treponema sp.]